MTSHSSQEKPVVPDAKSLGNIYYIVPDLHRSDYSLLMLFRAIKAGFGRHHIKKHWFRSHKPVGGIKVYYQHCMILQELGYNAYPLMLGKYNGNFFGYDVKTKHIKDVGYTLNDNDVIVAPEFMPYLGLEFKGGIKTIFAQNWPQLYKRMKPKDTKKGYTDLGYDKVMYCGDYIGSQLDREPADKLHLVRNYIDHEKFVPPATPHDNKHVMALPRKHPKELETIQAKLKEHNIEFRLVDGVPEEQIIREYQQADIFLATGYPEGFGLPPMEAMACGCAVVGYTGKGANEFMIDGDTALVAEDGNTNEAAEKLLQLVKDSDLKERLRNEGGKRARTYTREQTTDALLAFYNGLGKKD